MTDRALFHADNAYFYPAVRLVSKPLKTNTVSNTAFRGFGGPQGMVAAERIIEEIAYALGKDPLEVRKRNFYGDERRNVTPYHQTVEDNIIQPHRRASWRRRRTTGARRAAIVAYNAKSRIISKRHRADAGQVRHLASPPPGTTRPARWCTSTTTARST